MLLCAASIFFNGSFRWAVKSQWADRGRVPPLRAPSRCNRYLSYSGTNLPGLFRCGSEFCYEIILGFMLLRHWQIMGFCLTDAGKNKAIVFHSSCQSIQTMEHEFYECPEYLSNTPAEVERTEEYEYEVQFRDSELFYFMIVRPRAFFVQLN